QTGINNVGFNRMVSLLGGAATSDSSNKAQLISTVAANLPQKIKVATSKSGSASTASKRFRIAVTHGGSANVRTTNMTYEVGYAQLSQKIQNIQKTGGKIVSIREV
ncbi:MAG: phycobilisome linker polypeptide, partial [Microcystaceae cyanobacterium]